MSEDRKPYDEQKQTFLGFPVVVDPSLPDGTVEFRRDATPEEYAVFADYGVVAVFDTKPEADEFVRKNECTDEYRCQLYVRRTKWRANQSTPTGTASKLA